MKLNPDWDVGAVLKQAMTEKTKVEVWLRSGQKLAGQVAGVGAHAVHLTELTGREFFDAFVLLDEIAAIEARVR